MSEWQPCRICGGTSIQTHHVFGAANRKWSEKYGLKFRVCLEDHDRLTNDIEFNEIYKREYQAIFEETHTREEFMKIFGRNWI